MPDPIIKNKDRYRTKEGCLAKCICPANALTPVYTFQQEAKYGSINIRLINHSDANASIVVYITSKPVHLVKGIADLLEEDTHSPVVKLDAGKVFIDREVITSPGETIFVLSSVKIVARLEGFENRPLG